MLNPALAVVDNAGVVNTGRGIIIEDAKFCTIPYHGIRNGHRGPINMNVALQIAATSMFNHTVIKENLAVFGAVGKKDAEPCAPLGLFET